MKYVVKKTNKQKPSIFESQTITELLLIFTTNNIYIKTKLNKTKIFGGIKGRSRLVTQSVATILFSGQT